LRAGPAGLFKSRRGAGHLRADRELLRGACAEAAGGMAGI